MKKVSNKKLVYLAICSALLLCCFELKNVRVIVDEGSSLGIQLDLSDAELTFRSGASHDEKTTAEKCSEEYAGGAVVRP